MANPPPPKRASLDRSGSWCSTGTRELVRLAQIKPGVPSQMPQEKQKKRGSKEREEVCQVKAVTLLQKYEWPWGKLIHPSPVICRMTFQPSVFQFLHSIRCYNLQEGYMFQTKLSIKCYNLQEGYVFQAKLSIHQTPASLYRRQSSLKATPFLTLQDGIH